MGEAHTESSYNSSGFSGVSFIVKGTQDTWVPTYSFGSTNADVDLAQASTQTFTRRSTHRSWRQSGTCPELEKSDGTA